MARDGGREGGPCIHVWEGLIKEEKKPKVFFSFFLSFLLQRVCEV